MNKIQVNTTYQRPLLLAKNLGVSAVLQWTGAEIVKKKPTCPTW